jgi:hypothetical protein
MSKARNASKADARAALMRATSGGPFFSPFNTTSRIQE